MGDVALRIDDTTVVWLRAEEPAGARTGTRQQPGAQPPSGGAPGPRPDSDGELELPEEFGSAQPVSVDSRVARALTRGGAALEEALRPLGGVLGQIHRSISSGSHRPDEVTVEFGVTLGSDLSLGVFSGKGDASFKVSATWNLGGGGTAEPGGTAP
ncbi:CU044_2847 family protein [Streptomyces sp. NPDC001219]